MNNAVETASTYYIVRLDFTQKQLKYIITKDRAATMVICNLADILINKFSHYIEKIK